MLHANECAGRRAEAPPSHRPGMKHRYVRCAGAEDLRLQPDLKPAAHRRSRARGRASMRSRGATVGSPTLVIETLDALEAGLSRTAHVLSRRSTVRRHSHPGSTYCVRHRARTRRASRGGSALLSYTCTVSIGACRCTAVPAALARDMHPDRSLHTTSTHEPAGKSHAGLTP